MNGPLEPFSTQIGTDGSLEPDRRTGEQRLSEIRAIYQDVPPDTEDRVVYRVHHIPVPETASEIQCSTTVLEPGTVGAEYFMTKGHFHAIRDRSDARCDSPRFQASSAGARSAPGHTRSPASCRGQ